MHPEAVAALMAEINQLKDRTPSDARIEIALLGPDPTRKYKVGEIQTMNSCLRLGTGPDEMMVPYHAIAFLRVVRGG